MSSGNGIITLGEAIIYLRMSDLRDENGGTFTERAEQLRAFAAGLGIPAGRIRVAIANAARTWEFRPPSADQRPVRLPPAIRRATLRTPPPGFAPVPLGLRAG